MSVRQTHNRPNRSYPGLLLNGAGGFVMDTLRREVLHYCCYDACVSGRSVHVRSKPFGWTGVT